MVARKVENIDLAEGRADKYFCAEGNDLTKTFVILGWDEVDEAESHFNNPVWYEDLEA